MKSNLFIVTVIISIAFILAIYIPKENNVALEKIELKIDSLELRLDSLELKIK